MFTNVLNVSLSSFTFPYLFSILIISFVSSISFATAVLNEKRIISFSTPNIVLFNICLSSSISSLDTSFVKTSFDIILSAKFSTLWMYLLIPFIPSSFHGPPSSYAYPNINHNLNASEPYFST